jgi:hypothetical protein
MPKLHHKPFSTPQLTIFIIAFACIGYLIFRSFALNPNLPGDLNNDNTVNIQDLSILLSNYNTSNSTADINSDGTVNVLDMSILLSNYGQSVTISGVQIPSNIAADCSTDVTSQLVSWIGSAPDNSALLFGQGKCYRIEGTVEIRNRAGLTFEGNGSSFKSLNPMTDGVYADDQRAMFRAIDSSNLTYRNMTISGAFNFTGKIDENLQHAHAIDLRGTSAEVANVNASNIGGDCVYFGLGYSSALNKSSGSYHDSSCSSISRNTVSVVAGQNIKVQRVSTDKIGYDVFDVEPNVGAGNGASNVTFDNNTIHTYYLSAYSIVENAPIANQSFTNNRVIGRGLKITAGVAGSLVSRPNSVTISGNSSDTAQSPAAMNLDNIDSLAVTGNTVPMADGTMAAVDSSCKVNISGNSFPGGSGEYLITNLISSC